MANSSKASKMPRKKPTLNATVTSKGLSGENRGKPSGFQEIRELIDLLKKNDLAVLEFQQGDVKITLKTPTGATGGATVIQSHSAAPTPQQPTKTVATSEQPKSNYKEITSPMVGTFYAAPATDAPPYVEVGKEIGPETVVCIIEAMKVMNEIKAELTGKIVEIVAENGKPVQFGEVLFLVS